MKAIVYTRYGAPDVLQLRELPMPRPQANEILVRVRATTVTSGDWRVRSLNMPRGFGPFARLAFGLVGPRQPILGTELAGYNAEIVTALGAHRVLDYKREDFAQPGTRHDVIVDTVDSSLRPLRTGAGACWTPAAGVRPAGRAATGAVAHLARRPPRHRPSRRRWRDC